MNSYDNKIANSDNKTSVNDNRKYSCLKLNNVNDVKELIREVLEEVCNEDKQVEMSGRICNLLQVWLKGHEMGKMEDFEKRLAALEEKSSMKGKQ